MNRRFRIPVSKIGFYSLSDTIIVMKKYFVFTVLILLPSSILSAEIGMNCTPKNLYEPNQRPSIEVILNTSTSTVEYKKSNQSKVAKMSLYSSDDEYRFVDASGGGLASLTEYTINRYTGGMCERSALTSSKMSYVCDEGRDNALLTCRPSSAILIRAGWSSIERKF